MTRRPEAHDSHRKGASAHAKPPTCCGMPMAYSGQSGWYCLKCGSGK